MNDKDTYSGIFKGHRMGYGFVKSLNGEYSPDIFIPKNATAHAIEGDLVEVQITGTESKKGWEGKVIKIVERKHMILGGIVVEVSDKKAFVLCPLLGNTKEVKISIPGKMELKVGDRIRIELQKWKKDSKKIEGKFKDYIGQIKDPSCDITAAISEFALREEFPKAVLKEVDKLPKEIIPKDYPDRRDLQDLDCFTIDPDTAKDFDDAVSIEKKSNGNTILGVHIADVSYFVTEGSALDQEASQRSNSTYFPGKCVPMLPSALSDNLCSLKADVPRLAVSTFMTFDPNGELLNYNISRSIIKSNKRFTYHEVKKILDHEKKSPFLEPLEQLKSLALTLKGIRRARGCLDLALSDTKIVVNKKGVPTGIEVIEYDITHQMIEEFMLKNNEVIAKHLSDKEVEIPYRIHEPPKSDNLTEFTQIVGTMGFKLSNPPKQEELQALFDEVKGTDIEHQLAVYFIKCMKLATYNPENQGHYGLQLDYYCHFTSPIRRYVDLVIHRSLFNPERQLDCLKVSESCSEAERLSAKAENSVRTLKILRFLKMAQEKPIPTYHGLITKIKPFGIFFELPSILLEGFIHISKLGDDYYLFNEKKGGIIGEKRKERLRIGQKIKVKVHRICLLSQEVEWRRVT